MILLVSAGLTACQSTPEESVVVDKSQGIAQENIIPVDNENPKDLGIPEHWEEKMVRRNDQLVIEADYDIDLPDVYNTPVYLCEIELIDEEMLEQLCDYFANGNRLYEEPQMTKEELTFQKENMERRYGNWAYYLNSMQMIELLNEKTKTTKELIEKAPEQKEQPVYIDELHFDKPYQTEYEYVMQQSRGWNGWYEYYYETENEIGFTARVDEGKDVDPIIRALNYDPQLGNTTQFLYRKGYWIDETTLGQDLIFQTNYGMGGKNYAAYLSGLNEELQKEPEISEEEAISQVENLLSDLEIYDMKIAECVKVIGNPENKSWICMDENKDEIKNGYSIYLYPTAGDLIGYNPPYTNYERYELPETMYAPAYLTEYIHVVVTADGIQEFEWGNISQVLDTVADNTKMISFEEAKERLADHYMYESIADYNGDDIDEGWVYHYDIIDVQLRSTYINAFDDPMKVWLVPVWLFMTTGHIEGPEGKKLPLAYRPTVINAIDGGVVLVRE